MDKQFGVLTTGLDTSQAGVMITKNMNKAAQMGWSPTIFFTDFYQPLVVPLFSTMQDVEAWSFPHPVIATNLMSAIKLAQAPLPTKKLFYILDLEWLYSTQRDYSMLLHLYCHNKIELIARSESHAKVIEECWKKPIAIVKDFNCEDILKLL